MDRKMTQFDYLLNAFEHASQATRPAAEGYGDKRKALFAYVRGLEAAAPAVDAQPVAVPEACKALLREVMHNHRDKESPDYNACEDAQCMWCEEAAVFIAQPDAAPSPAPVAQPGDPMDWPLPCDVTVGHGTMRKGVKLSTLVRRMKVLYKMATGLDADEVANRSPEERQAIFDASPLSQFARRDGEAG